MTDQMYSNAQKHIKKGKLDLALNCYHEIYAKEPSEKLEKIILDLEDKLSSMKQAGHLLKLTPKRNAISLMLQAKNTKKACEELLGFYYLTPAEKKAVLDYYIGLNQVLHALKYVDWKNSDLNIVSMCLKKTILNNNVDFFEILSDKHLKWIASALTKEEHQKFLSDYRTYLENNFEYKVLLDNPSLFYSMKESFDYVRVFLFYAWHIRHLKPSIRQRELERIFFYEDFFNLMSEFDLENLSSVLNYVYSNNQDFVDTDHISFVFDHKLASVLQNQLKINAQNIMVRIPELLSILDSSQIANIFYVQQMYMQNNIPLIKLYEKLHFLK